MILRLKLGCWRFTFSFAPVTKVVGVNSLLPDGKHILMWDFDNVDLPTIAMHLRYIQLCYDLPNIYILETKQNSNYIAYCFKAVPWRRAVEIIARTPYVDWNFYKYGIYREYFTLRVSPKCGRKPKLVCVLESPWPEEVSVKELKSWVIYETLPDNYEPRMVKLEIGKS